MDGKKWQTVSKFEADNLAEYVLCFPVPGGYLYRVLLIETGKPSVQSVCFVPEVPA